MCLGIPGKIVEFLESPGLKMCRVDFGGVIRQVCIETIPEAKIGDYTIVHAGFALSLLSEEEAMQTMEALQELALAEEQFDQERLAGNEA
jgi:hydrogenase expression/formation protein HypC